MFGGPRNSQEGSDMLSSQFRLVFALTIVLLALSAGLTQSVFGDGGQWAKYSGNPVLNPTPSGWDSDFVTTPRVLYIGGTFRMWYVGGHSGTTGIGYANSTDGVTWKKYPTPVLSPGQAGAWDSAQVRLGSVVWNGTRFLMWYSGSSPVAFPNGAIGLATSLDGIKWTRYSLNPVLKPTAIDQEYMASPFVIWLNSSYNLWYAGRSASDPPASAITRILFATSFDGVKWNKWPSAVFAPSTNSSAWDSGSVYSPSVIFDGTNFGMWYTGLDQSLLNPKIGFATSPDGATWTRSAFNPILRPGPQGSWDSSGVEQPGITAGYGYMLYYDGFSQNVGIGIGLAQAPQGFTVPEFSASASLLLLGVSVFFVVGSMRQRRNCNAKTRQ
jgi:predicted GH43/DUF377 family glycosyl hydrolase